MAKKNYENMSRAEIIEKIRKKKEFSKIPLDDINLVYSKIEKNGYITINAIKETRDILRRMYTAFVSNKIFTKKDKNKKWFLERHISTKERINDYNKVYTNSLKNLTKKEDEIINIIDFGCGINGFSYNEFKNAGFKVKYIGTEPVGQLVEAQNRYFKKNNMNAKCFKLSLFDLDKNIKLIEDIKGIRVVFLFKVLDSLEMLKKNYSKETLRKIIPKVNRVVISWATKSLVSKRKFVANRKWLTDFLKNEFIISDEFETEFEKYIIITNKNNLA